MSQFVTVTKKALTEERNKNFPRAFNLLSESFRLTENTKARARILSKKGWCLQYIGNTKEAVELFNNLLEEFDSIPDAHLYASVYYLKTGKIKMAKNLLKRSIEKFPDEMELYLTLATILRDTERTNESIAVLKQALERGDSINRGKGGISRRDIYIELGTLYYERGDYNASLTSLKRALTPEDEETFMHFPLIAKCYLKLEDPDNTLKYIDKHLLYFEDMEPDEYITKARAHALLGDLPSACESILQAYDYDGILRIKTEEMVDFSILVKNGFFNSLDNVEIIDN